MQPNAWFLPQAFYRWHYTHQTVALALAHIRSWCHSCSGKLFLSILRWIHTAPPCCSTHCDVGCRIYQSQCSDLMVALAKIISLHDLRVCSEGHADLLSSC